MLVPHQMLGGTGRALLLSSPDGMLLHPHGRWKRSFPGERSAVPTRTCNPRGLNGASGCLALRCISSMEAAAATRDLLGGGGGGCWGAIPS